ncbi:MAG: ScyD/ScyE family protein [Actinomycetota bacterium]
MLGRSFRRVSVVVAIVAAVVSSFPATAVAVPAYEFAGPVFGLGARGEVLFAADSGAGIVRLGATDARLAVELPGVSDVAPRSRGRMWALAGSQELYRIVDGRPRVAADLGAFEARVNPDGGVIESNPLHLVDLGRGQVLIADAAANALLIRTRAGRLNWVATLPTEPVSTENAKSLAGCPDAPPDLEEICELPEEIPAEAVSTSVAVGPDGAFYVTELKGFPAPTGESRIWRIEPGSRHVVCGIDPECTLVADGFTSIVDITFAPDGTAYVVEFDEASWFAVELEAGVGGTINACDPATWVCTEEATDLLMPFAVAATASGGVYAAVSILVPGAAEVIEVVAPPVP